MIWASDILLRICLLFLPTSLSLQALTISCIFYPDSFYLLRIRKQYKIYLQKEIFKDSLKTHLILNCHLENDWRTQVWYCYVKKNQKTIWPVSRVSYLSCHRSVVLYHREKGAGNFAEDIQAVVRVMQRSLSHVALLGIFVCLFHLVCVLFCWGLSWEVALLFFSFLKNVLWKISILCYGCPCDLQQCHTVWFIPL